MTWFLRENLGTMKLGRNFMVGRINIQRRDEARTKVVAMGLEEKDGHEETPTGEQMVHFLSADKEKVRRLGQW